MTIILRRNAINLSGCPRKWENSPRSGPSMVFPLNEYGKVWGITIILRQVTIILRQRYNNLILTVTGKTLAGAFLGRHMKSFLVGRVTSQAAQSFLLTNRPTKEKWSGFETGGISLCKVEHARCMLNQIAMASALGSMLRHRWLEGQAFCNVEKRNRLGSTLKKGMGKRAIERQRLIRKVCVGVFMCLGEH